MQPTQQQQNPQYQQPPMGYWSPGAMIPPQPNIRQAPPKPSGPKKSKGLQFGDWLFIGITAWTAIACLIRYYEAGGVLP